MYNTDRLMIEVYDWNDTFLYENTPMSDGVERGKEWVRGYSLPKSNTVKNMGTDNDKHLFDVRSFYRNAVGLVLGHTKVWMFDSRERYTGSKQYVLNKDGKIPA